MKTTLENDGWKVSFSKPGDALVLPSVLLTILNEEGRPEASTTLTKHDLLFILKAGWPR